METVLVTGSKGLLGSAIVDASKAYANYNFVFLDRSSGDLTIQNNVEAIYKKYQPQYVIHAAARVGGIHANMSRPGELFYENLLMNSFMIHYGYKFGVNKLMCFSSMCSFPDTSSAIREGCQQDGKPFEANAAYGYAKRMVNVQINAYRKQYGVKYNSIVPGNIFGPNDNFSLVDGHVIPSLIHKCFIAKQSNKPFVIWGDGSPLREFMYSADLADVTLKLLFGDLKYDEVLVSNDSEISIKEVAMMVVDAIGFNGEIIFDTSKPNGQLKKVSDISRLRSILPDLKFTDHKQAINNSVEWFMNNYPNVRK